MNETTKCPGDKKGIVSLQKATCLLKLLERAYILINTAEKVKTFNKDDNLWTYAIFGYKKGK